MTRPPIPTTLPGGSAMHDLFADLQQSADATRTDITTLEDDISSLEDRADVAELFTVPEIAELPAADETQRGRILRVSGGTDQEDTVSICLKGDDNGYDWVELAAGTTT